MDSTLIVIVNLNLGPGARRLESHVNCSCSKRPRPSMCPFENERDLKSQRHLSRRCQVCTGELFALGSDCAVLTRESTSMTSAYLSLTCHTCHARRFPRLSRIAEVSLATISAAARCPHATLLITRTNIVLSPYHSLNVLCRASSSPGNASKGICIANLLHCIIANKNILRDCGPTAGRCEGRPTPNNGHWGL
jgi:hypothetical protein